MRLENAILLILYLYRLLNKVIRTLTFGPHRNKKASKINFEALNKLSRWRDSNPRPADYKSAALAS